MTTRSMVAVVALAALAASAPAFAHCDTLDGPVVSAARKALDVNEVNRVLIWVKKSDEGEIRQAFERARTVRQAGGAAAELADRYFYETLVRVHRAGEGAPYTGLKAAGEIEPPITAADKSVAPGGALSEVASLLTKRMHTGLHEKYEAVTSTRRFDAANVDAGRAHVAAYVDYVHYVERLYDAAATGHSHGNAPAAAHAH
jgi:hypothetical protein